MEESTAKVQTATIKMLEILNISMALNDISASINYTKISIIWNSNNFIVCVPCIFRYGHFSFVLWLEYESVKNHNKNILQSS